MKACPRVAGLKSPLLNKKVGQVTIKIENTDGWERNFWQTALCAHRRDQSLGRESARLFEGMA
jgi:hypothetical protein